MDYKLYRVLMGVFYGLAALFCVIFNSMVLIAFYKDPLKKLRKLFNYLLIHLCLCDLMAGLACFPIASLSSFTFKDERLVHVMNIAGKIALPLLHAGFFTTVLLSYDRYKAISEPIKYRQNATLKRFYCYVGAVWAISLVLASVFFSFHSLTQSLVINFVMFMTVFIILVVLYYRVRNVLHANQSETQNSNEDLLLSDANENAVLTRVANEKRALSTCKLIFLLQLLTISIAIATDIYIEVKGSKIKTIQEKAFMKMIFYIPSPISRLGNPLICMIRMTDFKNSIKALLGRRN